MKDYFSYNPGSFPPDTFRISPSQLSKFFDSTSQWYREHLLEEEGFEGSTASELGNVIHAAAHMYHDTKSVDKQALLTYIDSITNPEVDKDLIKFQMKPMIETLINNFLSFTPMTHAELFVSTEIASNVVAAGSIDGYDQHSATIYDYKTMGSLDKARVPKSFPRAYWFQQVAYAYILRQQGLPVNFLKLVYISRDNTGRVNDKGKPLKDYPSEVNIVTEPVTEDMMNFIEDVLKLVAESVTLWKTKSELRHILAQDYRLKAPTKPLTFT